MQPGADVDLAAGGWAVLAVLLLAAIIAAALRPALTRRRPEDPMRCNAPGSQGRHVLGAPGPAGVQVCDCGRVRRIPPAPRTDTREHSWPDPLEELPDTVAELLARASGHPTVWEAPTDEAPLPHLVWPPHS